MMCASHNDVTLRVIKTVGRGFISRRTFPFGEGGLRSKTDEVAICCVKNNLIHRKRVSPAGSVASGENDNQSFSNALGFASLPFPKGEGETDDQWCPYGLIKTVARLIS